MHAIVDPGSFARAMEFLSESVDRGDACERLTSLARDSRMFAIFRDVFPDDFAAVGIEALRRDGETREGVVAFAKLVGRLFPLHLEGFAEWGLGGIPFIPFIDHENGWDEPWDLPSAQVLGLYLGADDPEYLRAMLDALGLTDDEMARVPLPSEPGPLVYGLDAALSSEPLVLRRLASIALIPARETGLVFFDGACMCGGCGDAVEWSAENIRALESDYREASKLADAIRRLSDWLDSDRPRRVARAVRAWNRAVERERSHRDYPEVDAA